LYQRRIGMAFMNTALLVNIVALLLSIPPESLTPTVEVNVRSDCYSPVDSWMEFPPNYREFYAFFMMW
jgi:hypothetical protein